MNNENQRRERTPPSCPQERVRLPRFVSDHLPSPPSGEGPHGNGSDIRAAEGPLEGLASQKRPPGKSQVRPHSECLIIEETLDNTV